MGESSPSAPEEQSLRSSSAPEKWEEEDRVPLSWRCHHSVAVPKGVAPLVPALGGAGLLGRAASPRLVGKGKEKAKGKGKGKEKGKGCVTPAQLCRTGSSASCPHPVSREAIPFGFGGHLLVPRQRGDNLALAACERC